MVLKGLLTLLHLPNLRAQVQITGDIRSSVRLHFLYAGIECGLFQALQSPASKEDLVVRLVALRPELLDVLLELGVSLRELSLSEGRYRLRGRVSRALAGAGGDPIAAFIQEHVFYHSSVYRHFAGRLRGAPLGDYLQETGTMIARSSRVMEPFVSGFVRQVVKSDGPLKLLEIGCGSGVYLRHAAEANPQVSGVGIDLQPEVVDQTAGSLSDWGIGDRFRVMVADIRNPPEQLGVPFDRITLYNNIYYFDPSEYSALFRSLRSRLASGGALALVSLMQGKTLSSLDFDLVLRSTVGCFRLPGLSELVARLKESGFPNVKTEKLVPGEPLYGLIAR